MISKMESSLRSFGMSSAGHGGGLKEKAIGRLTMSSHMLLLSFVENRASDMSLAVTLALALGREVDNRAKEVRRLID